MKIFVNKSLNHCKYGLQLWMFKKPNKMLLNWFSHNRNKRKSWFIWFLKVEIWNLKEEKKKELI